MSREHEIRVRRRFRAPLRRVFAAWSDPEQLARWAWGSVGRSTRAEIDFRVGGSLRVETRRPDGARWSFTGTYTEIVPGSRIVHTLEWQAPSPPPHGNFPDGLPQVFRGPYEYSHPDREEDFWPQSAPS